MLGCVAIQKGHTLEKERLAGVPRLLSTEASVWKLSVAEEARKRGVARRLMSHVEDWARENGCTHVSLICGNPESQRFYRKIGYAGEAKERAERALYGADEDEVHGTGNRGCRRSIKTWFLMQRITGDRATVLAKKV